MPRRGMTLPKLLVASGLLLVLLTLVMATLYPTFANSARTSQRVEMQQRAALALDKLVLDLLSGSPASISTCAAGVAVRPLAGCSGGAQQLWQDHLVGYCWQSGTLSTFSVPVTDPQPARLAEEDFLSLAHANSGRVLARDVSDFSVTPLPDGQPAFAVAITVRQAAERFELRRTVALRNL